MKKEGLYMSRRNGRKSFGGPSFGDWAALGAGAAFTGYQATRIVKKSRMAADRRRSYEEQYNDRDIVDDYDRGYYLRESY